MKLMLFTPTTKSSAIGRMTSLVTRELMSLNHEVHIIRTENENCFNSPTHDFGSKIIPWCDFSRVKKLAQSTDAMIYQIGDNYTFHQGCLEWLPHLPGIVCLHDFFLGNLFNAWAQQNCPNEARAILQTWYGDTVANQFLQYKGIEAFIAGTKNSSPMTEWICAMAQGIITHSNWGIERVLKSCPGPVYVVPLAYDAPRSKLFEQSPPSTKKKELHILTVGHINKNKRVESLIIAISQSQLLREKSIYRLVGKIAFEDKARLSALARSQGVKLVISGPVNDTVLANFIEQADVMACLRWPALEAASASVIEALLYGKPTIVTNTGFYSEIPDNCTIKINPDNEIADIHSALTQLLHNPEQLYRLGQQGQQWARTQFTADNYAARLIEIIVSANKTKVIIEAVNYFNHLMYGWGANSELGKNYIIEPLSIFGQNSNFVDNP